LQIRYSWDEKSRLAKLSIAQTQKLTPTVMLFDVPLPVRFTVGSNTIDRVLRVHSKSEDFHIALPAAPDLVRIDPEYTVLAKVKMDVPDAMLRRQLANTNDLIGRFIAVEVLEARRDAAAIERLRSTLNSDPFHAVRSDAAAALRTIHSDEAFQALTNSVAQPDPRVRIAVLRAINGFYRDAVGPIALGVLGRETQPDVRIAAVRLLANPGLTNGSQQLLRWMTTNSFREEITETALESLRQREDPTVAPDVLAFMRTRGQDLPTKVQADGLATLAWLYRNADDKSAAREYLVSRVNDLRPGVRRAAISALGTLGDPQAIPVVETFARAGKATPEQAAAAAAVTRMRENRRPAAELGDLRREVTDLQKENRELKEEFEGLRKQLDALVPARTNPPAKTSSRRTVTPPRK
jgi:aminopeptidase N